MEVLYIRKIVWVKRERERERRRRRRRDFLPLIAVTPFPSFSFAVTLISLFLSLCFTLHLKSNPPKRKFDHASQRHSQHKDSLPSYCFSNSNPKLALQQLKKLAFPRVSTLGLAPLPTLCSSFLFRIEKVASTVLACPSLDNHPSLFPF